MRAPTIGELLWIVAAGVIGYAAARVVVSGSMIDPLSVLLGLGLALVIWSVGPERWVTLDVCWLLGHRWVDARNRVIELGGYCSRCGRLIASRMSDPDDVEPFV